MSLVGRPASHGDRTAVVAPEGRFTYRDLDRASAAVAAALVAARDGGAPGHPTRSAADETPSTAGTPSTADETPSAQPADLDAAPVCFLVPPGWAWVTVLWGTWRARGIAVPLAVSHPPPELARVLDDARPLLVVAHPSLEERIAGVAAERGLRVLSTGALPVRPGPESGPATGAGDGGGAAAGDGLPGPDDPALVLYTSGTTGPPKGVVHTHAGLEAQVRSLVEAWEWSPDDRILLHLPLHHVHGIVNVLLCALHVGAACEILPRFDAVEVWERLARGRAPTLYMAVPTVYRRLIDAWEAADPETRERWSAGARRLRLMVSGSAALPVPTLERWEAITGHRLLERYGMTEIGMALSNPLEGERRPGHVGAPLPGVRVRLVDEVGADVPEGTPGLIEVWGPSVFREYWNRPDATREAFTPDGWFRTGDRAVVEDGAYRILGRESVDILKTGGEKVSALEIEDALRGHPGVADCAVVGVPDPDWGERVCAAVVPAAGAAPGAGPDPDALRDFVRERLAPWKVPKDVRLVDDLPRNAMGKVTKPRVAELFEAAGPDVPDGDPGRTAAEPDHPDRDPAP